MPLYEYRCDDCRKEFIALLPMTAPREGAECPECKGTKTRRKVSTFAAGPASVPGAGSGASCAPGGG